MVQPRALRWYSVLTASPRHWQSQFSGRRKKSCAAARSGDDAAPQRKQRLLPPDGKVGRGVVESELEQLLYTANDMLAKTLHPHLQKRHRQMEVIRTTRKYRRTTELL